MKLDHATIVTKDVETMRRFFCAVAGLNEGPRPAFGVNGAWLYANGQPLIHLIEDTVSAPAGSTSSPRIDHVALRVDTPEEWADLLERMRQSRTPFQQGQVQSTGELQLFVRLAPGVTIEFVTRPRGSTKSHATS
jgi:catechol 2,3-dioxygenase-like lactoylglutathione lyase family enzyme